MPWGYSREYAIIKIFVSAYEDFAWRDSYIWWPDHLNDGAVDALVTRSDGKTLAIRHPLIDPFKGDRGNLESFLKRFQQRIEDDPPLKQTDRIVQVFVNIDAPPNALIKSTSRSWDTIGEPVERWLQAHLDRLGEGAGNHDCRIDGHGVATPLSMKLYIEIIPWKRPDHESLIRRCGPIEVDEPVRKAMTETLPKLAGMSIDKRILLVERNHWPRAEEEVWQKIRHRETNVPLLGGNDEIWIAETVFGDAPPTDPNWRGYLGFNQYPGDAALLMASKEVCVGKLIQEEFFPGL